MRGNPKMIVWLVATWHIRRSRRNQGWAWLFVMNQNRTSCSWSEWFDLRIEKLKNVHSPIMKEDVKLYGPLEWFWVRIMRGMSIFQLNPSLGWKSCIEAKQSILLGINQNQETRCEFWITWFDWHRSVIEDINVKLFHSIRSVWPYDPLTKKVSAMDL